MRAKPWHTYLFLIILYGMVVIWAVRSSYGAVPSALDLLLPLNVVIWTTWWVFQESKYLGKPIPLLARSWFLLLSWFLVPGYIVSSRGWAGVGFLVLNLIGVSILFVLTTLVLYALL